MMIKLASVLLLCGWMTSSFAFQEFIPEASAITKVGTSFVIAGDEEPRSFWISENGNDVEKVKVKGAEWDDMEALATVDDTKFFAITSHSFTKKGKQKPEREQLFLFSKNKKKIEALNSWSLRDAALAYLEKNFSDQLNMKSVRTSSPDDGGFNIEGMTWHAGHLFLGLRSPVTQKGEAIILVVDNAETNPVITDSIKVNLGGRGIRSLETHNDELLILSGSPDTTDLTFSVDQFHLGTKTLSKLNIAGFRDLIRPEGVVVERPGSLIFVQDFKEVKNQDIIIHLELR